MNVAVTDSQDFYRRLPLVDLPPQEVLQHRQYFHLLPNDWHIVVADIKDSTTAFRTGKYREINLLAASCVIAGLNLARTRGNDIPFVYGGDGATLAVPASLLPSLLATLVGMSRMARRIFGLDLRVGSLSVLEIEQAAHLVKVVKVHIAPGYNQALFLDDGLYYAEQRIKGEPESKTIAELRPLRPDLTGLQCRWADVAPPPTAAEIVCLIVYVLNPKDHNRIYREIFRQLDSLYGNFLDRHPLYHRHLRRVPSWQQFIWESYLVFGRRRWIYALLLMFKTWWQNRGAERTERERLIAASDIIKLDGSLKTIVSGTREQREKLLTYLGEREARGELRFGHAVTKSSFITCFVPQAGEIINFLDGSGGGYIQAASELKRKL